MSTHINTHIEIFIEYDDGSKAVLNYEELRYTMLLTLIVCMSTHINTHIEMFIEYDDGSKAVLNYEELRYTF
jgi:hypothetical protein